MAYICIKKKGKKMCFIIGSTKFHMCSLDKGYRNSAEMAGSGTLSLELGIVFIFHVDMAN